MEATIKAGRATNAGDRIAALRAQFPAAENWTYLNTASTGIMPLKARDAIVRLTEDCSENATSVATREEPISRARERFACLINADPRDISYTKNCTEGANIIANALSFEEGDNVVICGELEHPANIYPWANLSALGVDLRNVPARAQAIDVDALKDACDGRTRAMVTSTVTYTPGFRTDIGALSGFCRERDIFLFVDATQSVGVLETDVQALAVDGLATSTYKFLMGLFGQGFLYCRREWAERLRPTFLGKAGVTTPTLHPADDGPFAIRLFEGSRRFETGHLVFGSVALEASLELLLEAGLAAVEAHATALAERLADGFAELGLPVNRAPAEVPPSHMVTVGNLVTSHHHGIDGPLLEAVHRHLDENRVRHSTRRGRLRFGFHLYNNEADVERVLELAAEAVEIGRSSQ